MTNYESRLAEILDSSVYRISDIEPVDWAEKRMTITTGRFTGPLRYDISPFSKEILNCLSPNHPSNEVVVMGAAKWGKTKTIIEPAIAYWINEYPCEMLYLTGHSDLSQESMDKLDSALDNSGTRFMIGHQGLSQKNKKSGDTVKMKHFPMGSLTSGSATNHKLLRQRDPQFVIADDIEAAKNASKESGSTVGMIRKRTNSFGDTKKIAWISTPELKETSIIELLYKSGDRRRYYIPCQCCGCMIILEWEGHNNGEKYGFHWGLDEHTKLLIPGSVEYICQECGHGFNERNKYEFNLAGQWQPTCVAENPKVVSFHLPAWYQSPGMDDWESIVREYLLANPQNGQPQNKRLMQTWVNLTAGETYEEQFEELDSMKLQSNVMDYDIGIVPEKLSVSHGNGRVVLITCASDANGILENGRLDYEVTAWTETGSSYSLMHGSIGTFIPAILKRKSDILRDEIPWTYEENKPNCIWDEFEKILNLKFKVDVSGMQPRTMPIAITALDTGNTYKNHVFIFIEKMINRGIFIQGVKGRSDNEYYYMQKDATVIHKGKEVKNLWTLDVGFIKDKLAMQMNLNWDRNEESQPSGFMNFPHPGAGMYEGKGYFSHFQSEKRILVSNRTATDVKAQWVKVASDSQNHFWDCRVYNMAIKDIWILILNEKYKPQKIDWKIFVDTVIAQAWYK